MAELIYYVLVDSSTDGWELVRILKERGCECRIAPVPRGLQACCGMSILVKKEEIDKVREVLDSIETPRYVAIVERVNSYDPHRDAFC